MGRPKLKVELTSFDHTLEKVGYILVAILWACSIGFYLLVPNQIPAHFNFSGEVTSYASRGTLLALPAIFTFIYVLLSLINPYPELYNYPVRITEENAARQYQLAARLIRFMKVGLLFVALCVTALTSLVSLGYAAGLSYVVVPLILCCMLGPAAYYFYRAVKAR